jgi:uncharacterized protein
MLRLVSCVVLLTACDRPTMPNTPDAFPVSVTVQALDAATPTLDPERIAREVVASMAGGDFDAVAARFGPDLRAALTPDKMRQAWASVTAQAGDYQSVGKARLDKVKDKTAVRVTTFFTRGVSDAIVTVDAAGLVVGLFITPSSDAEAFPAPPYADRKLFTESPITVGDALPGTVTIPTGQGPFPAVVLVHGSGPQDRDETIGLNKPFRDLAWGLAARGVVVLRYDKRTLVHGAKMKDGDITVDNEVIDDAAAAIKSLRAHPSVDPRRVYVAGHSLGAYLVGRIGARAPEVAGLAALAPPGRGLEDLILDQVTYLQAKKPSVGGRLYLETLKKQVALVKSADLQRTTPARDLPLQIPAGYWLELRGFDAPVAARKVGKAIFFARGGRDYQVSAKDFEQWRQTLLGYERVVWKEYPKLNHMFMPGEGDSVPEEYSVPNHVSVELVDDLARWLKP